MLCEQCGAELSDVFGSCREWFELLMGREYGEPGWGAAHLIAVDAYALQHADAAKPRSNAFHLMRLCTLIERKVDPGLGARPPRTVGKAFEELYREFPLLIGPDDPDVQTVQNLRGAGDADEHVRRVRAWGESVWQAWSAHHEWARRAADQLAKLPAHSREG